MEVAVNRASALRPLQTPGQCSHVCAKPLTVSAYSDSPGPCTSKVKRNVVLYNSPMLLPVAYSFVGGSYAGSAYAPNPAAQLKSSDACTHARSASSENQCNNPQLLGLRSCYLCGLLKQRG